MRKTLGICLLVLLLTGSARAGIMPNLPPAPPPSSSPVQEPTGEATTDGEMPNPGDMPNGEPESLTQTVLDLLAALF